MIWNGLRVRSGHIQRKDYFNISRLSHSAECSKRYFYRGIVMIKRRFQTANAGRLCDLSREKVFQPIPQDWLKYKL